MRSGFTLFGSKRVVLARLRGLLLVSVRLLLIGYGYGIEQRGGSMNYRRLGETGLMVSEIGFGAEWMPGDDQEMVSELVGFAMEKGVNIVDCWMADPAVRKVLGNAVCAHRDK